MKTTEKTPISSSNALEALRKTMRANLELSTQLKEAAHNDPTTQSFYAGCEYAYRMAISQIEIEIKWIESPNNTTEQ